MNIWFDITNISTFTAGLVGIIRAELEIAYNFAKVSSEVRFCRLNQAGDGIEEVPREELDWLLEAKTPVDGFLTRIGRLKPAAVRAPLAATVMPEPLYAFRTKHARVEHAKLFFQKLTSILPRGPFNVVYYATRPVFMLFEKMVSRKRKRLLKKYESNVSAAPGHAALTPSHPFVAGDVLFSCGWKDSNKENVYAKVRRRLNYGLHISYLIYDTILINPGTKFLYDKNAEQSFLRYFKWISNNSDLIFYGGNTARLDSQELQEQLCLPVPEGVSVRFGDLPNDALVPMASSEVESLLHSLGVEPEQYLLCVGSIEPRKNHEILYKAYRELLDKPATYGLQEDVQLPKLVIAGTLHGDEGLIHVFKQDPKIKDLVVFVKPTDEELDALYRNCRFTLMPTLYEGWNLTLPESLSYGKFCISSDVAPMKEIGRDLVGYADPHEAAQWARHISLYSSELHELRNREEKIRAEWQNKSWYQTASDIYTQLTSFDFEGHVNRAPSALWFDLTLVNNHYGSIDGIPRVELSMAWELFHNPRSQVRFFEFERDGNVGSFIELTSIELPWLTKEKGDYVAFYQRHMEYKRGLGYSASRHNDHGAFAGSADQVLSSLVRQEPSRTRRLKTALIHLASILPVQFMERLYLLSKGANSAAPSSTSLHRGPSHGNGATKPLTDETPSSSLQPKSKALSFSAVVVEVGAHPFEEGDRIISMGLDWEAHYLQAIECVKKETRVTTGYFVHDMIPLLEPHFYQPRVSELYEEFYYWACRTSDTLFFGGNTAREDGARLAERYNLTATPRMVPLRLGAEFDSKELEIKDADDEALNAMGISRPFVLSVGTIQVRKNHEVLYRALVSWLENTPPEKHEEIPLFVFAGKQGWLVENLMRQMLSDERVAKHLVILQPNDDMLRVLYRNCLFTLLPSFYEGAALPISESLAYGKFCIAANVPPLREAGSAYLEYVDPRDVKGWRDTIRRYACSPSLLSAREHVIRANKSYVTWKDCSLELLEKFTPVGLDARISSGGATYFEESRVIP